MNEGASSWKLLAVIFALAMAIRVGYAISLRAEGLGNWGDQGYEIAENILAGKGYAMRFHSDIDLKSFRPPLFPLLLVPMAGLSAGSLLLPRLSLAFAGALLCFGIYRLGAEIFGRRTGLVAMAIGSVYPSLIYWGGKITPELILALFLLLHFFYLIKGEKNSGVWPVIASGFFLGLAMMTKSTAAGLIFASSAALIIFSGANSAGCKKALLMVVSCLLVISPWVLRNYHVHGAFVPLSTEGGITFYAANNPEAATKGRGDYFYPVAVMSEMSKLAEVEKDRLFYKKGLEYIREYPLEYAAQAGKRFLRLWRPYPHLKGDGGEYSGMHAWVSILSYLPVLAFAALGAAFAIRRGQGSFGVTVFLASFAYFSLASMAIRGSIRYRAPVEPFLIILAAYGLDALFSRASPSEVSSQGAIVDGAGGVS